MRTMEQTDIRTDEMVKSDIVEQLSWDSRIDASDISVTVDDGNVKLSGNALTYTAKHAATGTVWLVRGVESVDNQLTVEYSPTISVPDDSQIEQDVIDTLRWNPDLLSYKIDVDVTNGWVTLEGTVDAFWEKAQAEDDVSNVRGVIGVTNKLAVVPTKKVTDEAIAEDIVEAIDRNIHVNVDNVNVIVDDGEVTLTGTVPTWMAKSAAYNSALYTLGVRDVNNNIVVNLAS